MLFAVGRCCPLVCTPVRWCSPPPALSRCVSGADGGRWSDSRRGDDAERCEGLGQTASRRRRCARIRPRRELTPRYPERPHRRQSGYARATPPTRAPTTISSPNTPWLTISAALKRAALTNRIEAPLPPTVARTYAPKERSRGSPNEYSVPTDVCHSGCTSVAVRFRNEL